MTKRATRKSGDQPVEDSPEERPAGPAEAGEGGASKEGAVDETGPAESLKETSERLEEDLRAAEDKYVRALADLDNTRKHQVREKASWFRYGHETIARDLLSVLDNLERAMQSAGELSASGDPEAGLKGLLEGVELTIKQFSDTLGKHGVVPIESSGRPFDPRLHEAIQRLERGDVPPGTVVEEFLKGYMLHDRLLRAAKVIVSSGPESDGENAASDLEPDEE